MSTLPDMQFSHSVNRISVISDDTSAIMDGSPLDSLSFTRGMTCRCFQFLQKGQKYSTQKHNLLSQNVP